MELDKIQAFALKRLVNKRIKQIEYDVRHGRATLGMTAELDLMYHLQSKLTKHIENTSED